MTHSFCRLALSALLLAPLAARSYEGEVRRQEVEGGVHQPVLTKAPELLGFVEAAYPPEAAAQGLTASVKLLVTIGADGTVADATVPEPVGHGFDEAAIAAVRQFRFSPAEVDGVPAAIQIEYVYHFVLQPPAEQQAVEEAPPPAILEGQLIARGSRNRIPAATVRCGDAADASEAVTDEQGRFRLEVTPGSCQVRAVASGFQLFKTEEAALEPGETREVVYHLIPQAIGFETVVRGAREKKEVVRRTLERQELQKIPGTFGDPVRVLQNLPGVARAPYVSGQLIVRGARPDQTSTLFDGVEIPLLYHLGGGPSVVNAEFLDRIDFFPGGFGARYGRAVGGIVDVATRKGASDTWHGSAKVDFFDAGVFLESPIAEGASIAVAARRSYVDTLLPLVIPEDPQGGTLSVLPRYWDYQVRADFGGSREGERKGPHSFYVMAFGSDDVLSVVATGGGRNRDITLDAQTLFHRVKGDWTYQQGPFTSVFTPYLGYDLASFAFGEVRMDGNRYTLGAREDTAWELASFLTVRAGFDVVFEHLKAEGHLPVLDGVQYVPFPGAEPEAELQSLARSVNSFDAALYLETDVKLGPVTLTPGVRTSRSRLYGQMRSATDPRLWVRYQPAEWTALKASAGLYTQPPEAAQLEPEPLGNPALQNEKAFQASLGIEQRITENLHVDLTGYFNRRYDNVVSPGNPIVNADGSITRPQYSNDGLGRAYGLEVMVRHDITRNFFGWIAYTLNRAEQRRRGDAEGGYFVTSYDQTHLLTIVGSYRLPHGFELGVRFRYTTGRPTTPLQHQFDIFGADANRYYPTRGERFSTRLSPFHQLDVRLDKSWLFRDFTLTAYIDVQNLYNAQNTEAFFSDYRYREEFAVPGIPLLPVLGVKGDF